VLEFDDSGWQDEIQLRTNFNQKWGEGKKWGHGKRGGERKTVIM